jgi:hypothetical protein
LFLVVTGGGEVATADSVSATCRVVSDDRWGRCGY